VWGTPLGAPPPVARPRGGVARRVLVAAVALAGLVGGVVGGVLGAAVAGDDNHSTVTSSAPALATGAPTPVDRAASSVSTIAGRVLPSVVTVNVSSGAEGGTGSGVIIRRDGYVLTNNHVVAAAAGGGEVTVSLYKDIKRYSADIVGRDDKTDLAVVKIKDPANLPAATLGQSRSLVVGDPVVAIGAPLALSGSVTSGIVSALDRNVSVPDDNGGSSVLIGAIQTDAAINPGNSGGALVDSRGQVVGINSAIAAVPGSGGQSGNIGVGFAIPIDYAKSIAEEIIRTGKATHPYVGVTARTVDPDEAKRSGTEPGALVQGVVPNGPAGKVGLRNGDIIVAIDGTPVQSVADLIATTRLHRIGDEVTVEYQRGGDRKTVKMRLQDAPS
jgi:putative serine protease PepD